MRFRLDISYDGGGFHGWASQPGLRTVQGVIEEALKTIVRLEEWPRLTCAGRTDRGVHARGQVAHVDLIDVTDRVLERRLRRLLPQDVQIRAVTEVTDDFDARFSALERHYIYRLCDLPSGPDPLSRNNVVWHRRELDLDRMNAAAARLLGEHDFAAFCKRRDGATTIRTLKELKTVRNKSGVLETSVRADAFCRSMVRSLMGAIVAVGEGGRDVDWITRILDFKVRSSEVHVMSAHGLVLEEVKYPADHLLAVRAAESRRHRDPEG